MIGGHCNVSSFGFSAFWGGDAEMENIALFVCRRFDIRREGGYSEYAARFRRLRMTVTQSAVRAVRAVCRDNQNLEEREKMITGIVLINVERAMIGDVIAGLRKIDGVSEIYSVAGEYDLVAIIRVRDNAELADIIATKMTRDIDGIIHTKTLVTLTAYSKIDLDKAFFG